MFSPGVFSSNSFYGGTPSAPSVSTGYDGFDPAQISQNIAMAQALQQEAGALQQESGALSQAEGFDYARDAQAQAQDFDAMRDAEGGRLHADSLTGVPFAGGVTVMRNAAGRPMGPQTLAANLPFGAGTLAQQLMTRNTLVEPDDRFGFSGPLSTGSPGNQPSFGNPEMDMISVPSQKKRQRKWRKRRHRAWLACRKRQAFLALTTNTGRALALAVLALIQSGRTTTN
jgi:hypothetical protein